MNALYRSLIKPIRDPKIQSIINSLLPDEYSPCDKEFNFEERLIPIKRFVKDFKEWAIDIEGLDSYPYVYITNGNTEALNILFSSNPSLGFDINDYRYYKILQTALNKQYVDPLNSKHILFSWPSYNDGTNFFLKKYQTIDSKKHLDVAYLGLTQPIKCNVSSFEAVNISLSKTLAIPFNRIGITFSKAPISILETMNKIGYVNLSGLKIAHKIIQKIPLNYWIDNYWARYINLCKQHNLTETNCILFAYEADIRIGVTDLYD